MPRKKAVIRKKKPAKQPQKKSLKKPVKRKVSKKKAVKGVGSKEAKRSSLGTLVGVVTHYFPQVQVAVIKLKGALSVGEVIKVKGHTTDFTQSVSSIQVDHVSIPQAKKGEEIGLHVDSRVRQHDEVYKAASKGLL